MCCVLRGGHGVGAVYVVGCGDVACGQCQWMVVPVAARRTSQVHVENEQAAVGNGGGGGSSRAAGCTGVGVREGTQTNEVGEGWRWVGGGARWVVPVEDGIHPRGL